MFNMRTQPGNTSFDPMFNMRTQPGNTSFDPMNVTALDIPMNVAPRTVNITAPPPPPPPDIPVIAPWSTGVDNLPEDYDPNSIPPPGRLSSGNPSYDPNNVNVDNLPEDYDPNSLPPPGRLSADHPADENNPEREDPAADPLAVKIGSNGSNKVGSIFDQLPDEIRSGYNKVLTDQITGKSHDAMDAGAREALAVSEANRRAASAAKIAGMGALGQGIGDQMASGVESDLRRNRFSTLNQIEIDRVKSQQDGLSDALELANSESKNKLATDENILERDRFDRDKIEFDKNYEITKGDYERRTRDGEFEFKERERTTAITNLAGWVGTHLDAENMTGEEVLQNPEAAKLFGEAWRVNGGQGAVPAWYVKSQIKAMNDPRLTTALGSLRHSYDRLVAAGLMGQEEADISYQAGAALMSGEAFVTRNSDGSVSLKDTSGDNVTITNDIDGGDDANNTSANTKFVPTETMPEGTSWIADDQKAYYTKNGKPVLLTLTASDDPFDTKYDAVVNNIDAQHIPVVKSVVKKRIDKMIKDGDFSSALDSGTESPIYQALIEKLNPATQNMGKSEFGKIKVGNKWFIVSKDEKQENGKAKYTTSDGKYRVVRDYSSDNTEYGAVNVFDNETNANVTLSVIDRNPPPATRKGP
jgi:hypothetical protein